MEQKKKPLIAILTNNDDDIYCFRLELIQAFIEFGYDVLISCPYGPKFELMTDIDYIYDDPEIDRRGTNPIADYRLFRHYKKLFKAYKPCVVLCMLLVFYPQYRNLLRYRLEHSKCGKAIPRLLLCLLPCEKTLYLSSGKIGWNLFIQHGFATILAAKSVGEYCWLNQQVTVGFSFDDDPPSIGNGVRICAEAKIVGNVTVGDNAIIGANAVVTKDVPENAIMGGAPAKKIGSNLEHRLFGCE